MNILIKRILNCAGSILACAGVVFVVLRLNNYSSQLNYSHIDGSTWIVIIGSTMIYGFANILLALAWQNILLYFGSNIKYLCAIRIYGLTQLAKYVPGNIMHLASRQAMGLAANIPGWPLAKASIWDLGLMSATAGSFVILTFPLFSAKVTVLMPVVVFVSMLLLLTVAVKIFVGLTLSRAIVFYITFLTISGLLFVWILALILGEGSINVLQIFPYCGAFVVAWLIGLATPGAPAGVGVRELVLVFLLKGLIPESDLLLTILLSRVVTVGGDILFFLFSLLLSRKGY